jgi:hypothetical protein
MAGECRDPSTIGRREAAIWQPTLATSYRSSGEILATDNFFQDYKYFYGKPECANNNMRVIDERVEQYFFHEDGNLDLNGERFNYTQYCVATIGKYSSMYLHDETPLLHLIV